MEPVWQLLNTTANNDEWNGKHKAGLRSAAAGRQFTQARAKLCGWSDHDRCLVCLSEIVDNDAREELGKHPSPDLPIRGVEGGTPTGETSLRSQTRDDPEGDASSRWEQAINVVDVTVAGPWCGLVSLVDDMLCGCPSCLCSSVGGQVIFNG